MIRERDQASREQYIEDAKRILREQSQHAKTAIKFGIGFLALFVACTAVTVSYIAFDTSKKLYNGSLAVFAAYVVWFIVWSMLPVWKMRKVKHVRNLLLLCVIAMLLNVGQTIYNAWEVFH